MGTRPGQSNLISLQLLTESTTPFFSGSCNHLVLVAWSILTQFLMDRTHRVCDNNCSSAWCRVQSGVPQGSVLGPCCSMSTLLIYYKSLAILFMDMQMMWHLLPLLNHRIHILMFVCPSLKISDVYLTGVTPEI